MSKTKPIVCTRCGYFGMSKKVTKGSMIIEIALWLCLFFPGLIYSIWRLTTRHNACPKCGEDSLVPYDSIMGKKLIDELNIDKDKIRRMEEIQKTGMHPVLKVLIVIIAIITFITIITSFFA